MFGIVQVFPKIIIFMHMNALPHYHAAPCFVGLRVSASEFVRHTVSCFGLKACIVSLYSVIYDCWCSDFVRLYFLCRDRMPMCCYHVGLSFFE
jgi:hypothetical protein